MGADYIEPDLVMTSDGVLIARHENALAVTDERTGAIIEATTNVFTLPRFSARRATKVIDGKRVNGWFAEDFTLAEIKTLRARERIPNERPANTAFDDQFEIPTFQEVIDLAKSRGANLQRTIGIYPETKHPSYHASIGKPMGDAIVRVLAANGLNHADAAVFIQSFETANLRYLATITPVHLIQLLETASERPWDLRARGDSRTYGDLASAAGLAEIANYAHGVGPHKHYIIARSADGTLTAPSTFVADAHRAGLAVHPWTFRTENAFLPREFQRGTNRSDRGDGVGELSAYLRTGVDGFFTDHADIGASAVDAFARES
jgi:glycerophosphoryl diester phosphodiesterase